MLIYYKSKKINNQKDKEIDLTTVDYEIEEKDMIALSLMRGEEYQPLRIGLTQDGNVIDLVVDEIEGGHIIEGGLTNDGKYVLTQYIVRKGLDKFLLLKS